MRLLVSVASPIEAAAAVEGGADLVDVKDPSAGALGAAAPAVLRAVRTLVPARLPVSAALGDALDPPATMALAAFGAAACGADYVKVGLLGVPRPTAARRLLDAVRRAAAEARPGTRVVAVAYADAARAGGLPPADLPVVAADAGIHGILLDTAVKDGTTSLDALGESSVAAILSAARTAGLLAALAGSLRPADLPRAAALGAELVGVRGAACDGGRGGTVSAARVRALRAALGLTRAASPA